MKIFIQINDDDSLIIRARAEVDGIIGDMVRYVEPGQRLQIDGANLTYDDLIKHGDGEMIIEE